MPNGTSLIMVAPQPWPNGEIGNKNCSNIVVANLKYISKATQFLPHSGSRLHGVKRILSCTLKTLNATHIYYSYYLYNLKPKL